MKRINEPLCQGRIRCDKDNSSCCDKRYYLFDHLWAFLQLLPLLNSFSEGVVKRGEIAKARTGPS